MRALLIPVDGTPSPVELDGDSDGSTLAGLQRMVGGSIEPFEPLFGENICVYCNEEGMYSCLPNRAIRATKEMEQAGYASPSDGARAVREGELFTILFGPLVAVGFDPSTGRNRGLTEEETRGVEAYFTRTSPPGSGLREILAMRSNTPGRKSPSLEAEASSALAAARRLSEGHTPEHDSPAGRQTI